MHFIWFRGKNIFEFKPEITLKILMIVNWKNENPYFFIHTFWNMQFTPKVQTVAQLLIRVCNQWPDNSCLALDQKVAGNSLTKGRFIR